ncbi:hypothetical protein RND81_09G236500 [Saponaria officinalis]|uniref:Uncharacterized protein n=1 Tax=Saponaria officinalis TaxID=3572 RepID=A0AAW1IS81_SAPOF
MGSTHLVLFLSSSPINYLTINPRKTPQIPNFFPQFRSSSTSRSNRSTNSDAFPSGRFDFDDDFRRKKRRNWWSDDEDDENDDEDDDEEFVFWEEPNPIDWVFKVLSIFGWMVPAIIISTLFGTETNNSLIMALILPLGQTALSLVMDRLGGTPSPASNSSPRYKSRRRRRPKNRPNSDNPFVRNSYGNQKNTEARNSKSRTSSNTSSVDKAGESGSRFGGWDELDQQLGTSTGFSREAQSREVNGVQRQDVWSGKLSRTRTREKPLLMRLLIAVFPLLGSWTRFLF